MILCKELQCTIQIWFSATDNCDLFGHSYQRFNNKFPQEKNRLGKFL